MSYDIQPLGSRVLVRVVEEPTTTSSGIIIPDTAKEKPQRGEVVAIGDDEDFIKVGEGDIVLYPKYSGTELTVDGQDLLVLEAGDLLAVVRDKSVEA